MKPIIKKLKEMKAQVSESENQFGVDEVYAEACKIDRMHNKIKAVSENHSVFIERQIEVANTMTEEINSDSLESMKQMREHSKEVYLSIVNESPIATDDELSEDNIEQEDGDIEQEDAVLTELQESINTAKDTISYIREAFSLCSVDMQKELEPVLESISVFSETFSIDTLNQFYQLDKDIQSKLYEANEFFAETLNTIIPMVAFVKKQDKKLTRDVSINESELQDIASTYSKVRDLSEATCKIIDAGTSGVTKIMESIQVRSEEVEESLIKESIVGKPAGYAVYMDGTAIYGVGATEDEAWEDAEEWADTSSPSWKESFAIAPCSEELLNQVKQFGTPDTWGQVDGVLVTSDEESKMVA